LLTSHLCMFQYATNFNTISVDLSFNDHAMYCCNVVCMIQLAKRYKPATLKQPFIFSWPVAILVKFWTLMYTDLQNAFLCCKLFINISPQKSRY
jgi:hypothetical protein